MWLALHLGIQVIFGLPQYCIDQNYIGCYYRGEKIVYILPGMKPKATDHVVYHEIAHYLNVINEGEAELFARHYDKGYKISWEDVHPDQVEHIYIEFK